ncbi:ATP-binding protein [Nonomuraea sp. NPDC005650]|uniref:ATP-binding protein n=1 Tax=Nonomuraea sp. NPDC005650 TaxID=3157045 RepID=UPI00339F0C16
MTVTAPNAGDREDQQLLAQARNRNRDSLDTPPADLGNPAWLQSLPTDVRKRATAGLARAHDNVIHLRGQLSTGCTCPRPGDKDYLLRNIGTCPACVQAREEHRAGTLALQRQFRKDAWQRCLQEDYADYVAADLSELHPNQDPDGKVSNWLDTGSRTLILVGENSRGKTHTAFALGNHAAHERDLWVVAWNVADFHDALRPGGNPRAYEYAERCDLLIYDDMGAEKVSEAVRKQTYQLIDARVRNPQRRKTVITTNLPYDERGFADTPAEQRPVQPNLIDLYGGRIVHRIMHDATVVRVIGESHRMPTPW